MAKTHDRTPSLYPPWQVIEHDAHFEVTDIYQLPFPDGTFDAVFANGVLMHLREPGRALAEMHRVLRPGGIAGLRDPDFSTILHIPTTPLLKQ